MSTDAISTLNEISRLLFICGASGIFLVGILGSCANIYLLATRRYRKIPCSLFLWIATFFDLILLFIAVLLYRILNTVLQYDPMAINGFSCKMRLYLIDACLPIPIWCVCLSAFNRVCMTSRNAARRQWSTQKRSRIMATTLVVICMTYRLPDFYFVNVVSSGGPPFCTFLPSVSFYTSLHIYFTFPFLLTMIPIALLIIFSLNIRANLRLFVAQEAGARLERQMTLMILLQAIGAVCILPYAIYNFYSLATKMVAKSEYHLAVENLIYQITLLFFYAQYALAFYIYLIASSDVRQSVRFGWRKVKDIMGL